MNCLRLMIIRFRVVSLDGHRISIRKIELKESLSDRRKVIVPGKTLMEISKILSGETDEEVCIFFTGESYRI